MDVRIFVASRWTFEIGQLLTCQNCHYADRRSLEQTLRLLSPTKLIWRPTQMRSSTCRYPELCHLYVGCAYSSSSKQSPIVRWKRHGITWKHSSAEWSWREARLSLEDQRHTCRDWSCLRLNIEFLRSVFKMYISAGIGQRTAAAGIGSLRCHRNLVRRLVLT